MCMAMAECNADLIKAGAGANTKLHHIPKLQALNGVEVRVIANRTQESAEKVCREFGVAKVSNANATFVGMNMA